MTNLERMRLRTKEPDDAVLMDCLESAKAAILSRRFPYGGGPTQDVEVVTPPVVKKDPETGDTVIIVTPGKTEVIKEPILEPQYLDLQYRIAIDLYNKTGAEGQLSHSENGISRTWESSWISEELLGEVVPMVGVI